MSIHETLDCGLLFCEPMTFGEELLWSGLFLLPWLVVLAVMYWRDCRRDGC